MVFNHSFCRLEELATYAVITVIVDFLIFMSFYPAGLSLVIELMFNKVTKESLFQNNNIVPFIFRCVRCAL